MHHLVVDLLREHLIPALVIALDELRFGFGEELGVPVADDGVHGVVGAAAVQAQPLEFHVETPLVKVGVGTGVFAEVAHFVALGLVPRVTVETGIDDEDVARVDIRLAHEHLGRVEVVIVHLTRDIHHHAGADPFFHGHHADGAAGREKVDLAVHVGAHVVAGGDDLAVGALAHVRAGDALEILHGERHVARPGRGVHAQRLGEVVELHLRHVLQKIRSLLVGLHDLSFFLRALASPINASSNGLAGALRMPAPTCPTPGFL